ncbi:MAG: hypothetical protein ACI396_05925 [Acutalibacteraceae bacterium]
MTDNEIIKALECCVLGDCDLCNCKCGSTGDCRDALNKKTLDLINRQQAEIERLKKLLAEADTSYNKCAKRFYKEGVKEFAEKLKFVWFDNRYDSPDIDFDYFVDILVEILVGDTE